MQNEEIQDCAAIDYMAERAGRCTEPFMRASDATAPESGFVDGICTIRGSRWAESPTIKRN
jgi:hypothetical protein